MRDAKKRDEGHFIFRPYITRNGERIWARRYGLRAWRIWVPAPPPER